MNDRDDTVTSDAVQTIALIPARAGSERIKNKNMAILAGKPLIHYAIASAIRSAQFSDIVVSTDSPQVIAYVSREFPIVKIIVRPAEFSGSLSPDIEWITHALDEIRAEDGVFSILRPTAPFRTPQTIMRAMGTFIKDQPCDSIRAVQKCKEHPYKMWLHIGEDIKPLLHDSWHSKPYQALPEIYVQNASLEVAFIDTVKRTGTIAGNIIRPFFTQGYEGFDINTEDDLILANALIALGKAMPYKGEDNETATI